MIRSETKDRGRSVENKYGHAQSEFQSTSPDMPEWTPEPFNLLDGNPFEYSEHTVSFYIRNGGLQNRD